MRVKRFEELINPAAVNFHQLNYNLRANAFIGAHPDRVQPVEKPDKISIRIDVFRFFAEIIVAVN